MKIVAAANPNAIKTVRELFEAYARELKVDLCFQNFAEELAHLPGKYSAPNGRLLLAYTTDGEVAGCVAMRPLEARVCEMKRLFVRPEFRRGGVARALVAQIMNEAHAAGYQFMRLDTLPALTAAIALYEQFGFYRCAPYYETPLGSTVFFEAHLH